MKKTSYSFLIPAIVGVLTLVICFITWRVEIYRVTFINALAMQYIATGSLLLSLALMVIFIWKGRLKGWPFSERLKVFIGTFIISMPLAISSSLRRFIYWMGKCRPGVLLTNINL